MFYESDRIVRKQRKFINSKAHELIDSFKQNDLKTDEIIAALEVLLLIESNTEFDVDVITHAKTLLKDKDANDKENKDT